MDQARHKIRAYIASERVKVAKESILCQSRNVIPYKDMAPSRSFPFVTALLVSANVGIFVYQTFVLSPAASHRFLYKFAVIPLEFKLGHNIAGSMGPAPILTVLSAMFLHGGWLHLIGNMLYLWIFGDNVEDRMGPLRFTIFYLLCGLAATFAQIYTNFQSDIPALGASGAIAGVLAAYLRLYPNAKVAVLVPIFYFFRSVLLPAWLVLGIWFLVQILSVRFAGAQDTGGVAYFAHIGGFAMGFLLMPLFVKGKERKKS